MSDLRIEKVDIIDCSDLVQTGDDTHLVAVQSAGLTGWYGPVSGAVASLVERCIGPLAIGRRVADHAALLVRIRRAFSSHPGPLTSWAVGALDCAVWDLHGRAVRQPVAALLGPMPPRNEVDGYASWLQLDIGDAANASLIQRVADQGWRFTKWGLRADPQRGADVEAERLAMHIRQASSATGARVAFDALWSWPMPVAAKLAEIVDVAALVWIEEPLAVHNHPNYADVLAEAMPLALGERVALGDDPTQLLSLSGLRAFIPDVVGCGGLTAALDLVRWAKVAGVPIYPHGRSLVPAVHLAAAFPDEVVAVEYQVQWEPRRQRLFTEPIAHSAGVVHVPQGPGLGPVPRRS
jgi:L-alanine-DL-glutamate epimerase-like enolase superfamily enzyme